MKDEATLRERVITIQDRTVILFRSIETSLVSAIDSINAAQTAGARDANLTKASDFHRRASIRWNIVSSENSTGFHSPQESARIRADAIDYARQTQIKAILAMPARIGAKQITNCIMCTKCNILSSNQTDIVNWSKIAM
jgi:nitrite reductase (cytochrome c-552)